MAQIVAFNFEAQLRIEVGRILEDLIFVRSPSQAKLLKFLLEATLSNAPPPSQYEIAVDALGRAPDYDITCDSYPRVQISRLRKNLTRYYERNLPAYGMRVMLDTGLYQLSLAAVEKMRHSHDTKELSSAQPAMIADQVGESKPDEEDADATTPPVQRAGRENTSYLKLALVPVSILACMVLGAWLFLDGLPTASFTGSAAAPLQKPLVAIVVEDDDLSATNTRIAAAVAGARQVARRQLMNSFVSRLSVDDMPHGPPDYILQLDFRATGNQKADVLVSLIDRKSQALFTETKILNSADLDDFITSLEGNLIYMTAPTGIIASHELTKVKDATESPFACFLSIESLRSHGDATGPMVDTCLAKFPASDFAAFWFARRSFEGYQGRIASTGQVSRSGREWDDLQEALERDRFNPFATFVAAKVELSQGNCSAAQDFISRTLGRGSSYPILVSAMQAEASACQMSEIGEWLSTEPIHTVFAQNPSPDPLLRVYLIIAAIAADDMDLARKVAGRGVIEHPSGPIETTAALLSKQLTRGGLTPAQESQLAKLLPRFLWNRDTRDLVRFRILELRQDEPAALGMTTRPSANHHS